MVRELWYDHDVVWQKLKRALASNMAWLLARSQRSFNRSRPSSENSEQCSNPRSLSNRDIQPAMDGQPKAESIFEFLTARNPDVHHRTPKSLSLTTLRRS